MGATKRQEQAVATRAKVLAAAASCFAEQGYEGATIRVIAKAAGLTPGAVFTHFAGKAELYTEVMGHPPVTAEIGAGLLSVVKLACGGVFDRERAEALIAKLEGR